MSVIGRDEWEGRVSVMGRGECEGWDGMMCVCVCVCVADKKDLQPLLVHMLQPVPW